MPTLKTPALIAGDTRFREANRRAHEDGRHGHSQRYAMNTFGSYLLTTCPPPAPVLAYWAKTCADCNWEHRYTLGDLSIPRSITARTTL